METFPTWSWGSVRCFQDIGAGKGKYYAVNFPLRDGIDDESYEQIFKPVSTTLQRRFYFHNPQEKVKGAGGCGLIRTQDLQIQISYVKVSS